MAKVLLIDDDLEDRELFCEAMEEVAPEIDCYTAPTGPKALAMLECKEVELPNLIFLDVNLPKMTGWQCLSIIKEKEDYKSVPVIMYSTTSEPEDINRALELGALCFYTKPPDFKNLKKDLQTVVTHLSTHSLSTLTLNLPPYLRNVN